MLDPAGPAAQAIAQTSWVMFIGAIAIWLLMLALFAIALWHRRSRPLRRPLALIVIGGLAFPVAVLLGLLIYGTFVAQRVVAAGAEVQAVIDVRGAMWHWTFRHMDTQGRVRALSRDHLTLPAGRLIEFRVSSDDVIHSFWIPRLGGKIDAIPGRRNVIRLQADAPGRMTGQCAEFCGLRHAHMRFDVEVLPPAQFDAWLDSQPGAEVGTGTSIDGATGAALDTIGETSVKANPGERGIAR